MDDTDRGRIRIDLFTTLDGVAQAPGGPDEDPSDGFLYGGWQVPFEDELIGTRIMAGMSTMDALLLGRRTYDIFAGYWPHHGEGDGPEAEIGRLFNRIPKYVATRGTLGLEWANCVALGPDIVAEVDALRDRHRDVHVIGSLDFARTLFTSGLWDELNLWVYPVVLGQGRRVFQDGTAPHGMRLIEPPAAGPTGAVALRYAPGPEVTTGVH